MTAVRMAGNRQLMTNPQTHEPPSTHGGSDARPQRYQLGLDLGGTSVKAVAVTSAGESLERFHEPFELAEPLAFARAVRAVLDRATATLGVPAAVGLSAPGIAAKDGRSIAFMPGRFEGLEGLVWGEYLGRNEGVPVLNDAQSALLGEVWCGAALGARNVVLLTLGTGVGGAAMVDGRLLRGHNATARASAWGVVGAILPLLLIAPFRSIDVPSSTHIWVNLGALAVVSTVFPVFFLNAGIQKVGPARAAIIGTVEPLLTIILAALFLGERLQPIQLVGGAFILASVILLQVQGMRRPSSSIKA